MHSLASQPDLYGSFVEANGVEILLQLLGHENSDVVCATLSLLRVSIFLKLKSRKIQLKSSKTRIFCSFLMEHHYFPTIFPQFSENRYSGADRWRCDERGRRRSCGADRSSRCRLNRDYFVGVCRKIGWVAEGWSGWSAQCSGSCR